MTEVDSSKGECPMCNLMFPMDQLCSHASYCNGKTTKSKSEPVAIKRKFEEVDNNKPTFSLFMKKSKTEKNGTAKENIPITKTESEVNTQQISQDKDSNGKGFVAESSSISSSKTSNVPLAERMRPLDFSSYSGQSKALGEGSVIRTLLEDVTKIPSLILWGPPGCGKTSLANIIANKAKSSGSAKFVKMSACTCGVAEVKNVVQAAKTELSMFKRRTILFLDEVHRFNKTQQDTFLPHIESGAIVFIGATTENPSFSLNNALLSRCKLVSLEKLSSSAIKDILSKALVNENATISESPESNDSDVTISPDALTYLSNIVDGDARAGLTYLEMLINNARRSKEHITLEIVGSAVNKTSVKYDRKGDQHYFMASALQKSIRGSDDNAALYWLARMLKGGEDPAFIARRLVRCASEDIGLADNNALPLAVSAMQGAQLLGKPECDVLLAQCTVYLSRAKKSHEVYGALTSAYNLIDNPGPQGLPDVPIHLRQGGGKVGSQLGWGQGYSFDLSKVGNIQYLPDDLKGTNFF